MAKKLSETIFLVITLSLMNSPSKLMSQTTTTIYPSPNNGCPYSCQPPPIPTTKCPPPPPSPPLPLVPPPPPQNLLPPQPWQPPPFWNSPPGGVIPLPNYAPPPPNPILPYFPWYYKNPPPPYYYGAAIRPEVELVVTASCLILVSLFIVIS